LALRPTRTFNFFLIQNLEIQNNFLIHQPLEELDPALPVLLGKVELPSDTALLRFFNNHAGYLIPLSVGKPVVYQHIR
jgi:hypothetical protein